MARRKGGAAAASAAAANAAANAATTSTAIGASETPAAVPATESGAASKKRKHADANNANDAASAASAPMAAPSAPTTSSSASSERPTKQPRIAPTTTVTTTTTNDHEQEQQQPQPQQPQPTSTSTSSIAALPISMATGNITSLLASSSSRSSSASSSSSSSIPRAVSLPALSAPVAKATRARIIVVLVKSSLETVKTKKGYELVCADTHKTILQRLKKDPAEYRPDITHQCLLTLLDSPLNKAGMLQVYIQTERSVLIEVNPSIRIPRTFKRFAGLMVQLLHKLKIRSTDGQSVLLKAIKNPVTQYLPAGALRIGTSVQGELVDIRKLAIELAGGASPADPFRAVPWVEGRNQPVVFCFGSHASGPAEVDWTERSIAVSQYPLSASVALSRMLNAFEGAWGVL